MCDLDDKYAKIVEERKTIITEINKLEKSEIIKKYNMLRTKNENLYQEQIELDKKKQREKYNMCDHVWITSKIIYNDMMNNAISECGCIKCGLDESVLNNERSYLSYDEQVMYDYLKSNLAIKGIKLDIQCDLDLAKAIYCKIQEAHPDIDDKTAIKYLEIALDNIRNIEVSSEREENRAKRLQLRKHFRNWQSDDIWTN